MKTGSIGIIISDIIGTFKYEMFRVLPEKPKGGFDYDIEILSNKLKVPVNKHEVYFQDHPEGYNQPCFN